MSNPTALVLTYSNQTITGKKEFKDETTINKLNINSQIVTPLSYTHDTHTDYLTVNNNIVATYATIQYLLKLNKQGSTLNSYITLTGSSGELKRFLLYPSTWRLYLTPGSYAVNWAMNGSRAVYDPDVSLIYQTGNSPTQVSVVPASDAITYTVVQTLNANFESQENYQGYVLSTLDSTPYTFNVNTADFYNFGFTFNSGTGYGTHVNLFFSKLILYEVNPLI